MNINNTLNYKVADHIFCIKSENEDLRGFLPSFNSFIWENKHDEEYLFTLDYCKFECNDKGEVIYQFDWEGAMFKFFKTGDLYLVELSNEHEPFISYLLIGKDFKSAKLYVDEQSNSKQYILSNMIMMLFTFASAPLKTVMIHSSVIVNNGYGYLFLGKSGTGKSTHSSLWFKHIPGSELLNDDNPILRIIEDKVYVYGSPWSGKTPCYKNEFVPVGAFLKLKQAPYNRIIKPGKLMMFGELLSSISSMKWDKNIDNPICDTLVCISELTELFSLECLPDAEAAKLSYSTIRVDNKNKDND